MVRKILGVALILLCSAVPVMAATVTLTWDHNPEPDVVGYVVFYGTTSGQYDSSADTGNQTSLQLTLPDSATQYYFAVCAYNSAGVRSALSAEVSTSTSTTPTLVVTSLRSSVPAPQAAGTPVTFYAAASGGVTPTQFKWWILYGSTWRMAQDWTLSNTFTWTPVTADPGYNVAVWARNATSTLDAADNPAAVASVQFPITQPAAPPLALTDLHANVPSPQLLGTSITFSAAAAGGVGPYQYKWLISNGSTWSTAQGWSGNNSFVWTPSVSGSSSVGVWVRSATSTADAPDNAGSGSTMPFAITDVATVTMVANKIAPQPIGTKIQFTATVPGVAGYQYKWWVFNGSAWIIMRDWSTDNRFFWTPSTAYPSGQVLVRVQQVSNPSNAGGVSIPFPITGNTRGNGRK